MKKALLVTTRNFLYREALVKGGYAVTEYRPPLTPDMIAEVQSMPGALISITEPSGQGIDADGETLRALCTKGKVICFSRDISAGLKGLLLDCGISDVLEKYNADTFASIMKIIEDTPPGDNGAFLLLDDESAAREAETVIITRFNYRAVRVGSVEELFGAAVGPGVRFILVNLGAKSLDLRGLVRKFHASTAARNIPVIAYKDMSEGLFVHELVGGLNRLTRYILSREELLSLLVDMLFRRELIPLVASLRKLSDFDASACYDAETLAQAFFQCEKNIFSQANLLDHETFTSMARVAEGVRSALLKVESLKWLKIEMDRRDVSTAGRVE
jgi:hypothetical protein